MHILYAAVHCLGVIESAQTPRRTIGAYVDPVRCLYQSLSTDFMSPNPLLSLEKRQTSQLFAH